MNIPRQEFEFLSISTHHPRLRFFNCFLVRMTSSLRSQNENGTAKSIPSTMVCRNDCEEQQTREPCKSLRCEQIIKQLSSIQLCNLEEENRKSEHLIHVRVAQPLVSNHFPIEPASIKDFSAGCCVFLSHTNSRFIDGNQQCKLITCRACLISCTGSSSEAIKIAHNI